MVARFFSMFGYQFLMGARTMLISAWHQGEVFWEPRMPFGKRIDGPSGRRNLAREAVVLAASAQGMRASRSVVMADVSTRGAKLQGRALTSLDEDVLISVGDVDLFAKVAWAHSDECGIVFEEPLTGELVEHIKREGGWAKVMGLAA